MLSRRRFLQLAGITLSAAALPRLSALPLEAAPSFEPVYGRALDALPVYATPGGRQVARLWSDTVAPILGADGDWYRLTSGYARREGLQPMIAPAQRGRSPTAPPFWGSVSGAVAVVRAWCAADAPIVTRIGHGGVLRVTDALENDGLGWYGVAESEGGDLLGWTQAADWSPVSFDTAPPNLTLALDQQAQRLSIREGDHVLLTAPVSTGRNLPSGVFPVTERSISLAQGEYHGAPWSLRFGGNLSLTGVYWHNRFGQAMHSIAATPGIAIQVTPPLARWIYPRAAKVIIY